MVEFLTRWFISKSSESRLSSNDATTAESSASSASSKIPNLLIARNWLKYRLLRLVNCIHPCGQPSKKSQPWCQNSSCIFFILWFKNAARVASNFHNQGCDSSRTYLQEVVGLNPAGCWASFSIDPIRKVPRGSAAFFLFILSLILCYLA